MQNKNTECTESYVELEVDSHLLGQLVTVRVLRM
jgi:hypothetical protein